MQQIAGMAGFKRFVGIVARVAKWRNPSQKIDKGIALEYEWHVGSRIDFGSKWPEVLHIRRTSPKRTKCPFRKTQQQTRIWNPPSRNFLRNGRRARPYGIISVGLPIRAKKLRPYRLRIKLIRSSPYSVELPLSKRKNFVCCYTMEVFSAV